jgi:hypothetical protein
MATAAHYHDLIVRTLKSVGHHPRRTRLIGSSNCVAKIEVQFDWVRILIEGHGPDLYNMHDARSESGREPAPPVRSLSG